MMAMALRVQVMRSGKASWRTGKGDMLFMRCREVWKSCFCEVLVEVPVPVQPSGWGWSASGRSGRVDTHPGTRSDVLGLGQSTLH